MVVTINNVIESCVRGNSSLYSIHSFVDTWSALLRWTEDVFGSKQGGVHVPSFCKLTWSDPERSEFSTDLRAPQARSRERQPLFVVSQRFLKRFGLKSRNPLETCEVRVEEISFVKLAIKYSTTLSKDSAYSATKRLIHRIGAAMSTGADCEIDFGVGRLHCHERQVWFVFNEEYQRNDDPFDRRPFTTAEGNGHRKAAADTPSKPFISVPRNMAPGTLTATHNAFQSLARPSTSMSAGTTLSALMAKAGINSSDAQRVLASGAAVSGGVATAVTHKPNDIPSIPVQRPSTASAKSQFSCAGSSLPGGSPAPAAAKQPKLVQSAVALALLAQQQQQKSKQQDGGPPGALGKPPLPNHMKATAPSFPLIPASGQPMPVRRNARCRYSHQCVHPFCAFLTCLLKLVSDSASQRANRAMTPGTKARVDAFKVARVYCDNHHDGTDVMQLATTITNTFFPCFSAVRPQSSWQLWLLGRSRR